MLAWWFTDWTIFGSQGGNQLRRTAGVGIGPAKIVERYVDFFLAYLVSLFKAVSQVSLVNRHESLVLCPGTFGVPSAMRAIDA